MKLGINVIFNGLPYIVTKIDSKNITIKMGDKTIETTKNKVKVVK